MASSTRQKTPSQSSLGMDNQPRELQDQPSHNDPDLPDVPCEHTLVATMKSKLELLSTEIQEQIYKHYFQSFEIEVRPIYQPFTLRSCYDWSKYRPFYYTSLLAWSPFPGPMSLVLTSRTICHVALPLMESTVSRSLHLEAEVAKTSTGATMFYFPLAEVNLFHSESLMERIDTLYIENHRTPARQNLRATRPAIDDDDDDLSTLQKLIWDMRMASNEGNALTKNLKTVEIDYNLGKRLKNLNPKLRSKRKQAVKDIVVEIMDSGSRLGPCTSMVGLNHSVAGEASTLALAGSLFGVDSLPDGYSRDLRRDDRKWDLRINVTVSSEAGGAELHFTAVLPYNKCQGTCKAKTLQGDKLKEWKRARKESYLSTDCTCVMVEGIKVVGASVS